MHLRRIERAKRGLIRCALLQVKVPQSGVRVLIASDGVWDAFEKMLRVCRMARAWHVEVRGPPQKGITLPTFPAEMSCWCTWRSSCSGQALKGGSTAASGWSYFGNVFCE